MTHTKGPWKFEIRDGQAMVTTIRHGQAMVVAGELYRVLDSRHPVGLELEEVEANARLIAKAPEMLDAITAYLDALESSPAHILGCVSCIPGERRTVDPDGRTLIGVVHQPDCATLKLYMALPETFQPIRINQVGRGN